MKVLIVLMGLLVGCASGTSPIVLNPAKEVLVPIAQPCNVVVPEVPKWEVDYAMPTDMFGRMDAALNEIEQRKLYEIELETLLTYCIKPNDVDQSEYK